MAFMRHGGLCVAIAAQVALGTVQPFGGASHLICSSAYQQEVLAQYPLVVYFHDPVVLQPAIDHLLDTYRSQIEASDSTFSASSYLHWKDDTVVTAIVHNLLPRVEHFFPNTTLQIESAALTRYTKGQSYSWHVDAYDARTLHARAITFLAYLNDVDGGETVFAHIAQNGSTFPYRTPLDRACATSSSQHVKVAPQAGRALLFQNVLGHMSTHAACAVTSSAKWIMQLWISSTTLDRCS
ncbi:hypothetical protein H310_06193 [Aphanomyces invadans]|uniref:Fe2OG dioxygenase domain-containing protein n=1 Tax=Aphanomyces invadans TaxID=157072 RepID=A0A024U555_9STRA|nr:hypothetical protein H310_06193 [Aphanomyces invadans]ETW01536.1 hypothetical protein H310_06193 [Aphanomyces invadans]|eukprot:XP_008869384.1 hypothetical protein H310_06193 [Aphanomyces invadans]